MTWITKTAKALIETLELSGRARALVQLRQLDPEFLRQYGYSPEKLARGVAAWPWRVDEQPLASAPEPGIDAIAVARARAPAAAARATDKLTEAA